MLLALAPLTASALTTHLSAVGVDLAAGIGWGGAPATVSGGGVASLGWFRGQFDDQFSFGRYWWLGPTARVDGGPGGWRVTPTVELRRGLDLLVAGVSGGITAGPVLAIDGGGVGWTARAVGVARLRRTRSLSLTARLEAGADGLEGAVAPAGGLSLGVTLARPLRDLTAPTAASTRSGPVPPPRAPRPAPAPPPAPADPTPSR